MKVQDKKNKTLEYFLFIYILRHYYIYIIHRGCSANCMALNYRQRRSRQILWLPYRTSLRLTLMKPSAFGNCSHLNQKRMALMSRSRCLKSCYLQISFLMGIITWRIFVCLCLVTMFKSWLSCNLKIKHTLLLHSKVQKLDHLSQDEVGK